ncbi:hypothetical protein CSKR_113938, partial [Clonorchis sinensis]
MCDSIDYCVPIILPSSTLPQRCPLSTDIHHKNEAYLVRTTLGSKLERSSTGLSDALRKSKRISLSIVQAEILSNVTTVQSMMDKQLTTVAVSAVAVYDGAQLLSVTQSAITPVGPPLL